MSSATLSRPAATRSTLAARATAVLAALGAALAVWAAAGPLLGVEITAVQGDTAAAVGPVAVTVAAVLAGLAGWALLAVLERVASAPRRIWVTVAAAVLLVSLVGTLAGTTAASVATLACLHLAVGGVLLTMLGRTAAS